MRAISQQTFGGTDVLEVVDLPKPEPLPTEVLVRVISAGINPVDVKTRAGGGISGVLGEPPFTLGWDVSGVVEEIGFGVHTLAVGDEVFGFPRFPHQAGGFAEYVTAPSRQFARKPATLDHDHTAAIPLAGLTAWQLLTAATSVQPGQRVLIHAAAGGVGHFAVQLAAHLGAHVIGTASAAKHAWLRDLGAAEVIDYRSVRFEDAVTDIDLVIDLAGDELDNTSTRSLATLRPGGTLIAVPGDVSPELYAAAEGLGVTVRPFLAEPDGVALTELAQLVDEGAVSVAVEQVFGFEDIALAHQRLESGRTQGKLVVRVAGDDT